MAAILKLRRGTSIPSLVESELFFDTTNKTVVVGDGSTNHTLVKIGTNQGSVSLTGDITASNITITGNALVQGNITFGGSLITLGDEDTDDIVFVGELSSSLIPNNDNAFDIGSSTRRYKTIYGVSASFENVSLPGTGILSSSLQDFDTYSSSIESQLDSVYTFTQSADQRLTSIEGFTQSVDLRVDTLELSQSYFDNTFSGSVDSRLVDAELTGSDHELRIDTIETTFSSSVDLRLDNAESTGSDHESRVIDLESTGSDHENRITSIEGYSSSLDSRLDDVEWTGSNQEGRLDILELSQSYFDNTFSGSVDSRLVDAESTGSDHESRVLNLELTGSDHELRVGNLEIFSSSEYQIDSSSFDNRIQDLTNVTGSYATTGSNVFIGDQTITGSIIGSGSVSFNSIPWPVIGTETHLFKTDPYTVNLSSGNRDYSYLGIALEQILTGSIYENSLLFYTYDDPNNKTYGSETLIGPTRNHMRVLASGSDSLANISVEDVEDGTTIGKFYADDIQIGLYTGSSIEIGNSSTLTNLRGTNFLVNAPLTSSNTIEAIYFYGDGSNLTFGGTDIVSGSTQIDVNSTQNFQTYSQSVDSRLDSLEVDSHTHSNKLQLDTVNQDLSKTSDVIFNDITASNNLLVNGDLTVIGSATQIYSTELTITDKLITLASGSINSVAANGAGIEIDGANQSLTWNAVNGRWDLSSGISSSFFIGDGSGVTNVTAAAVDFYNITNRPAGLVSGSTSNERVETLTQSLDLRYLEITGDSVVSSSAQISNYNVFLEINGDSVVSGSSQVDLTQTTNYVSGIKSRLNTEGVFSGSTQVEFNDINNNLLTTNPNSITASGHFVPSQHEVYDLGSTELSWRDLYLSGSTIHLGGTLISINDSGDVEFINETTQQPQSAIVDFDTITNKPTLVSGSSQIDLTQTTNYQSGIKDRLNAETVVSGSDQVTGSLDFRYLEINGDNVFSSSIQVNADDITNFDSNVKDKLNVEGVISGSEQVSFLDIINKPTLVSGSDQVTESLDFRYLEIGGDNVVSGSSQIDVNQTQNFQSFSGSVDTRLFTVENDRHNHTNKANLDTINQDLSTLDVPTFANISLPDITSLPTASEFSVLLYSQSGEITYSELGTAAYYHVSQSISSGDPNVLGNAKAVKDYIDEQLLIIGAGDITEVVAGNGMSGGALSGSATLTLDTASAHFTNGVLTSINSFSSSVDSRLDDLETFSSSLDADFVTQIELAAATGALENSIATKLDTGSYNTDSSSFDSRLDTLESETHENPLTFTDTTTIDFTRVGDSITADVIGGVVSGSSQIDVTQTTNYSLINQYTDSDNTLHLNSLGVISGSSQVLGGSGIVSSSTQISNYNVFAELGGDNLFSSSIQVDHDQTTNFVPNEHIDHSLVSITGTSGLSGGGNITTSRQISLDTNSATFTTGVKTKLNVEGVISGSDQLTGSLVDIASAQSISGTKTFEDIIVNGTGSFAYIQSVTGSAKIIGDAFVVVNNDTPTERYAGLAVYDSGSASPTTASLFFDGQTNDWNYEYFEGGNVDFGVLMFGPEYNTKGSPTYLTNNRIPKGNGGHHLNDSNITDSGTLITLGSNVQVNGNIELNGTVDGIDLQSFSSSVDTRLDTLEGETHENPLTFSDTATIDFSRVGDNITANVIGGVISGSFGGDVTGTIGALTVGKVQGVAITSGEATQLANINTTTISATQWGYVGALDQGLTQTSTVQFGKVGVGGASDATYELKVTGDIGATGDVVAYVSSDRRLKDEITPIENSLQKINSIGGYSFVWNEKSNIYKGKDYGVIAQEIENILPELVETREDGYKAVKYDRIVSLLIEGVKELSKEVSELKEKIGK